MNFIYQFPNRDRMRKTPKILIKHLKPCLKEDIYSPIPLFSPLSQISIHVDASDQGWGATFATEKETFHECGKWEPLENNLQEGNYCNSKSCHVFKIKGYNNHNTIRFQNSNFCCKKKRIIKKLTLTQTGHCSKTLSSRKTLITKHTTRLRKMKFICIYFPGKKPYFQQKC